MFATADVHYPRGSGARAALVLASGAAFSVLVSSKVVFVEHVAAYRPGEFYLRELPPLRALMTGISDVEMLVVDGYVTLDPDGRPGLGAYAHEEFGVPVIGVAKTAFKSATHAIPVLRGTATRPLYVRRSRRPTVASPPLNCLEVNASFPGSNPCAAPTMAFES